MPVNYVEPATPNAQNKSGCLPVLLWLMTFGTAIAQMFFISGFWLGCGMFLTILAGGLVGGSLGLKIGGFLGSFTCPRGIFTQEGLAGILWLKLFWLFGPRLIGLILGWILGMHLLLMLFFGMPATSLCTGKIEFDKESKPVTLSERKDILKKNIAFIGKMQDADPQTKRNMLLMVAIDSGSVVTVEQLLAEGVDVNTPRIPLREDGLPYTENGEALTPLWSAISYGFDRSEIAMLLMKHGADVNVRNEKFKGPTPLLQVLRNRKYDLVIPLIQYGAKLDVTDIDGKTPLHHAANKDLFQAAILMLDKGAALEVKDKFGNTPLDYANEKLRTVMLQRMKP